MKIPTLIVDDDPDIRLLARLLIEAANDGLTVAGEAASGTEALARLDECRPTVAVVDYMMPELTGIETARQMRERCPALSIVLFSAYLTTEIESTAKALGISACLSKSNAHRLPDVLRQLATAA